MQLEKFSLKAVHPLSTRGTFVAFFLTMLVSGLNLAPPVDARTPHSKVSVLVSGTPLRSANGLIFDEQDVLYVAGLVASEIVAMNPHDGRIRERIRLPESNPNTPDDVAIGPDGSLYWTSFFTGKVYRRNRGGTITVVADLPVGVNSITFSDDGRLFVGLITFSDAIYEIDPDGITPPRLVAENLGWPNAFDFGPDGLLYCPLQIRGQVVRVDVDSRAVETVTDGLGLPVALKFDSQGHLYVLDSRSGHILLVDTATGNKEVFAERGPGMDNLAFDSHDQLYVSNAIDSSIVQVRRGGASRVLSPGRLLAPGGVAVLSDGRQHSHLREQVVVADFFSLNTHDGQTGRLLNREPGVGITLAFPATVSAAGETLILTSWFTNTVQIWDPVARRVLRQYSNFSGPMNAILFQGDLVVAEIGTGNVVRASAADGAAAAANRATLGNLYLPLGLAATADDLWATDWVAGTLVQLVAGGITTAEPIVLATGLAQPEGLAVDRDGTLLVVESGAGRLSRFDPVSGEMSVVADGLQFGLPPIPLFPPQWVFSGVAVGPSGTIYVTGDRQGHVYRISP